MALLFKICIIYNSKISLRQNVRNQINPIALKKAKIVYNFGLSECNSVKDVIVKKSVLIDKALGADDFHSYTDLTG